MVGDLEFNYTYTCKGQQLGSDFSFSFFASGYHVHCFGYCTD